MEIEKLLELPEIDTSKKIKVTEMGNIIETQYMSHRNTKQTIQMLDGGDKVCVISTGEIREVQHHKTRAEDTKSLAKTFKKCRDLINSNITDVSKVRWCTLTYAENMTDTKKLYKDFEKFNKRFQTYCKKHGYSIPEYIVMMEPQERGAWHAHLLYIWQDMNAPFIPNTDFAKIWGHGFVKIKRLDNVDNVGAYLTAYLGDMELSECNSPNGHQVVDKIAMDEDGNKVSKKVVKGARLKMYPANFNMIRYSKGCQKPEVSYMYLDEVKEKVSGATKTFETAFKLTDTQNDYESIIIKKQYNKIRGKKQ